MINWEKTALLFPGQGSQEVGMGKEIAATYDVAAQVFAESDRIFETDFSKLCWEGPEEELNDTYNTQPALFVTSMAIYRALQEELKKRDLPDPTPAFMAGHSLGEFTALVVAGVLTYEDGLRLVRERARLMHEADKHSPGAMAAIIGMDKAPLEDIVQKASEQVGAPVVIANDNCPGQIVISGDVEALEVATEMAKEAGARMAIRIAVSIAAHSPLMERSAEDLRREIEKTPFNEPQLNVVGNALSKVLENTDEIRTELNAQLASPVRWHESMQVMLDNGVDTFIELGSKDILSSLMKRINRKTTRISVSNSEELLALFDD